MKRFLTILFFTALVNIGFTTTYYSISSGKWDEPTTWNTNKNGSGSMPSEQELKNVTNENTFYIYHDIDASGHNANNKNEKIYIQSGGKLYTTNQSNITMSKGGIFLEEGSSISIDGNLDVQRLMIDITSNPNDYASVEVGDNLNINNYIINCNKENTKYTTNTYITASKVKITNYNYHSTAKHCYQELNTNFNITGTQSSEDCEACIIHKTYKPDEYDRYKKQIEEQGYSSSNPLALIYDTYGYIPNHLALGQYCEEYKRNNTEPGTVEITNCYAGGNITTNGDLNIKNYSGKASNENSLAEHTLTARKITIDIYNAEEKAEDIQNGNITAETAYNDLKTNFVITSNYEGVEIKNFLPSLKKDDDISKGNDSKFIDKYGFVSSNREIYIEDLCENKDKLCVANFNADVRIKKFHENREQNGKGLTFNMGYLNNLTFEEEIKLTKEITMYGYPKVFIPKGITSTGGGDIYVEGDLYIGTKIALQKALGVSGYMFLINDTKFEALTADKCMAVGGDFYTNNNKLDIGTLNSIINVFSDVEWDIVNLPAFNNSTNIFVEGNAKLALSENREANGGGAFSIIGNLTLESADNNQRYFNLGNTKAYFGSVTEQNNGYLKFKSSQQSVDDMKWEHVITWAHNNGVDINIGVLENETTKNELTQLNNKIMNTTNDGGLAQGYQGTVSRLYMSSLEGDGYPYTGSYQQCSSFSRDSLVKHTPEYPLPVSLINFSAENVADGIKLFWETTSESNNSHFVLYKSDDCVNFYPISNIIGSGNSSISNQYDFIDNNPYTGISYYRLEQVDFNGNIKTYPAISVYYANNISATIYPTIAEQGSSFTIDVNGLTEYNVELINSLGKVVEKLNSNISTNYLNLTTEPSGLYFMKIISGEKTFVQKVFIK